MKTIKVNPDELLANVKKIENAISSYEKHCKELTDALTANEAQIDDATQASLVTSINAINQRFSNISNELKERNKIITQIAQAYKNINTNNVAGAALGLNTMASAIIRS